MSMQRPAGIVVDHRRDGSGSNLGWNVACFQFPKHLDLAVREGLSLDDLNIFLVLPSNEAVREAVEAGAGATIISRHVVASRPGGSGIGVTDSA